MRLTWTKWDKSHLADGGKTEIRGLMVQGLQQLRSNIWSKLLTRAIEDKERVGKKFHRCSTGEDARSFGWSAGDDALLLELTNERTASARRLPLISRRSRSVLVFSEH